MSDDTYEYFRAFYGEAAEGNPCGLRALSTALPDRLPAGSTTRCLTRDLGERRAEVRCFSDQGRPIECCGHGLLCSAAFWRARWECDGGLVNGATHIPFRQEGALIWLQFPYPDLMPSALPQGIDRLLPGAALSCDRVGTASGYLLVELQSSDELTAMTPPGEALKALSDRALLVYVRCAQNNATPTPYCFRYFAPQYGSAEDTATGSAMRLITASAGTRYTDHEIMAAQLSPGGGLLYGAVEGDTVWVGGQVQREQQIE
ncbi:PhzF family phenazine biosynthesis protein [Luminiphilus sp.]|nr:PhzF family phenazine biosynthesis protein [Luminiphilus sp.]